LETNREAEKIVKHIVGGIYQIKNLLDGKIYIGSSFDTKKRMGVHLSRLRKNKHCNKHLQNAWNKYGEENFEFKILLYCEPFELLRYEQWFIDNLKPEYNILPTAGSCLGVKQTSEHIEKRTKYIRGNKMSDEARHNMSLAHLGKKQTIEHIEKVAASHRGKHLSEKTKKKIGDANRGHIMSNEQKEILSKITHDKYELGLLGTPEINAKISKALKGRKKKPMSEEQKLVLSLNHMGKNTISLDENLIKNMYNSNHTMKEISKIMGVSKSTIKSRLLKLGVSLKKSRWDYRNNKLDDQLEVRE
jgi:group I intron endonuclease